MKNSGVSINGQTINLGILDTPEFFVDERMSFDEVENYLILHRVKETNDAPIALCANFCKCNYKVVSREESENLAQIYNERFFETSSSEFINADDTFLLIK